MKYIITESKLESAIMDYFDELFDVSNINSTNPYDYDEDTGEEGEDENRVEFYIGDYGDEETCFRWYDCGYFKQDSHAQKICPTVTVESPYDIKLNGLFGDLWHEPFQKWFKENFDLPIKTVEVF